MKFKDLLLPIFIGLGTGVKAQCVTPNPVTASSTTICSGKTVTLSAVATGLNINWYTVASGGSPVGTSASGANFTVNPSATTSYYAESFSPATSYTFNYTGAAQNFTVPAGVTSLSVDVYGAQGGTGASYQGSMLYCAGGLGGRVTGTISVTPGDVLQIYVGGVGGNANVDPVIGYGLPGMGGFNGGGMGGGKGSNGPFAGGGGGGASDIRVSPYGYTERLVVAGGGAGSGSPFSVNLNYNKGGDGGGLNGADGWAAGTNGAANPWWGYGGTQSAGGAAGTFSNVAGVTGSGNPGGLGFGGSANVGMSDNKGNFGGGGGAGYYGGGAGCNGGGGGGSSLVPAGGTTNGGVRTGDGLIVISIPGCTSTRDFVTVNVDQAPVLSLTGGNVCAGGSATLTASGANTYTWSTGENTASIVVSPSSATSYTVKGTGTGNCMDSLTTTVYVSNGPVLNITPDFAMCDGASDTLSVTDFGLIAYYRFDEGTGTNTMDWSGNSLHGQLINATWGSSTAFNNSGSHINFSSGNPNRYVTVQDNTLFDKLKDNFTLEAWIYQTDASNNTIIDRGSYNFLFSVMPNSTTGLGFFNAATGWTYSGGTIPLNQWVHVAVTFNSATDNMSFYLNGNLLSTQTLTTPLYNQANQAPMNIGRQEPFSCQCNVFDGSIDEVRVWSVARTQAQIQAAMIKTIVPPTYTWDNGTTLNTTTLPQVITTTTVNTVYQVTVTDEHSCVNTASVSVTVNTVPSVSVTSSAASVCSGSNASLTATGANSYEWSTTESTSTITVSPTSNTDYTVTGTSNNCSSSAVVSVSVNPLPSVDFNVLPNLFCADEAAFTLSATPVGGVFGGTSVSAGQFDPSAAGAGTYTLSYQYTDANNCVGSDTAVVNVQVCTSLNELQLAAIRLYPNPAQGKFSVMSTGVPDAIIVCDVTGKEIIRIIPVSETTEIDSRSLSNGVYFLKLQYNYQTSVKRIVINN